MLGEKWAVMKDDVVSESSVGKRSDAACKSRTLAFDPTTLPFDYRTHTAVKLQPSDPLFTLVMAHLCKPGVTMEDDAISFQMSRAEKAGGKKRSSCGYGCSEHPSAEADVSACLENVSVSLGVGVFRFTYKGNDFKALHQQIGDPVGTGCGPAVMSDLVIFKEGVGAAAAAAVQSFLSEILAESEKTAKNTFQVYRWHIKYGFWQRVSRVVARPVSSVVLPEETSSMIVDDMEEFLSDETAGFYQQHGIPYKRSYLFYGVPGAGKTSMIQALAGKFGRNVCYLSPTHPELDDDSLKSAIERVPENAVVILEDVDALFGKHREKKISSSPLTFSGLLNALDGVGNHSGVIFILTTNFKDQLDAALIRDGRVDVRIKFDYCTPDQMEKMFETYFPPAGHADAAAAAKSSTGEEDPEIAALEARLAALTKAKAAGKKPEDASEHVTGATFRDALLLALGERKVSAAQLQSFFVKQRKASAKGALDAVPAWIVELEQRDKENAEEAAKKEAAKKESDDKAEQSAPKQPAAGNTNPTPAAGAAAPSSSAAGGQAVHVHIHTGAQ